jgi:Na+/H+ antiporter NhaD/arsenite permease-like protein
MPWTGRSRCRGLSDHDAWNTQLIPHLPDPGQAWLTLAMASTLAGNLTILGSIATLIVVEGAGRHGVTIRFLDYLRVGLPVTLISLAFGIWWLS